MITSEKKRFRMKTAILILDPELEAVAARWSAARCRKAARLCREWARALSLKALVQESSKPPPSAPEQSALDQN